MKYAISFLLQLSFFLSVSGQVYKYAHLQTGDSAWVIATSGLNLRQESGLSGKKLATIPFGEKVRILSSLPDSVNELTNPWVKVQYGTQLGWCHADYLGKEKIMEGIWANMVLLTEEKVHPGYPLRYQRSFQYYGVYAESGGFRLKPVQLSFVLGVPYGLWAPHPVPTTQHAAESLFLLGSKHSLQPGRLSGCLPGPVKLTVFPNTVLIDSVLLPDGAVLRVKNGPPASDGNLCCYDLDLKPVSGPVQSLFKGFFGIFQLEWAGDLDRDGKTDLLISNDHEKSHDFHLYLSSKAGPGESVFKVATWSLALYGC